LIRRLEEAQKTGHATTTDGQGPEDQSRRTEDTRGAVESPRQHGGHTGPRGLATPSLRIQGAQWTSHDPIADTLAQEIGPAPPRKPRDLRTCHDVTTTQGEKGTDTPSGRTHCATKRPRPHCGQTGPRETATPPRRTDVAQDTGHGLTSFSRGPGTGHAPTEDTPGPGDRPRQQGGRTGAKGPATHIRCRPGTKGPATHTPVSSGNRGTGHAPK